MRKKRCINLYIIAFVRKNDNDRQMLVYQAILFVINLVICILLNLLPKIKLVMKMNINISISVRHIHLSKEDFEKYRAYGIVCSGSGVLS